MKQRMQGMVMGILVMSLLLGTVTVLAATTRVIEVNFGNYRVAVFGQEIVARNAEGVILEPFSYNGEVYVPVTTILRAMGNNASWDAVGRVLHFGQATGGSTETNFTARSRLTETFYDSGGRGNNDILHRRIRTEPVTMGGRTYEDAITYRSFALDTNNFSLHNLGGQYSIFTGYFGRVDGSAIVNATLNIYGDGSLITSYDLMATDLPSRVSISVAGVRQLKIEFVFPNHGVIGQRHGHWAVSNGILG